MSLQAVLEAPPIDRRATCDPWWARLADALTSLAWQLLWGWRR